MGREEKRRRRFHRSEARAYSRGAESLTKRKNEYNKEIKVELKKNIIN